MQYTSEASYSEKIEGNPESLRWMLSFVNRRRTLMLLAFTIFFSLFSIVIMAWPSKYTSSATILVEAQEIPKEFVQTSVTGYVEERIQAITQLVLSRQNISAIIKKYNLYSELKDTYTFEEITEKMRKDITLKPVKAETGPTKGGRVETTTIAFTLGYKGKDPETVAQVANALVSLYLEENLRAREAKANITYDFLEVEAAQLRESIQEMEGRIAKFKEINVYSLPELMQVNLQSLDHYQKELDNAKATLRSLTERKVYLQGQLATIDPSGNMVSLDGRRVLTLEEEVRSLRSQYASAKATQTANHPDVLRTKAQLDAMESELRSRSGGGGPNVELATARSELRAMEGRYGPTHPDVVRQQAEVARLEGESTSGKGGKRLGLGNSGENPAYINIRTQITSTDLEIDALRKQIAGIEGKYTDYQKRIELSPRVEQDYRILQRDYASLQTKYGETVSRLQSAKEAKALEQKRVAERLTVIDAPIVPEKPSSPNRPLLMILGILLSLGAGVGSGYLVEITDRSLQDPSEIFRLSGFPVLSVIPQVITKTDAARLLRKRVYMVVAGLTFFALFLLALHVFVRPLDVVWFQIMRKFSLIF